MISGQTKIWVAIDSIDVDRLFKNPTVFEFYEPVFIPGQDSRSGQILFNSKAISPIQNEYSEITSALKNEQDVFIAFDKLEVYRISDINVLNEEYYFTLKRMRNL